ncbi:hypothetical protein [Pleomorphovibrio marinus]|uniref:hypothetical protein n=1 Tax=Pleomorphovibrio marinus TaxID=2164132 RepID=UPI0013004C2C|nr:hypothetical protein [Pleomorphovibrio marinus]
MTPAIRTVNRFLRIHHRIHTFTAFDRVWHFLDTSSAVTVSSTPLHLPDLTLGEIFSQTLSTMALYQCTFGWFEAPSCKATPLGRFHHLIYSMQ